MDRDVYATLEAHDVRITALESGQAKMESAMVELTKKVDDLTKSQTVQLEILHRLDQVASNPQVKVILTVLAAVLGSWAASKGLGK